MKRTPLKPRSKKTAAKYVERRKLVAFLMAAHPICEVPWCTNASDDVHEPLTRARGGSITDPANAKCVCRLHHDLIHANEEDWIEELGFLKHSWDGS